MAKRYIKNSLINTTPGGMKALNQNFDFLYIEELEPISEIASIQILSDSTFTILFVNGDKESWTVVRTNKLITSLVSLKRVIPITRTL
ncbi:MAG: hypothetical protein WCR54_08245 [Clostridia bacterium]